MADDAVVVEVGMDISDSEKEIARLHKSLIKLQSDLKIKLNEKDILTKDLESARKKYEELSKQLAKFEKTLGDSFIYNEEARNVGKQLLELKEYISETEKGIKKTDSAIGNMNRRLEATNERYKEIYQKEEELKQVDQERIDKENEANRESVTGKQGKQQEQTEQIKEQVSMLSRFAKVATQSMAKFKSASRVAFKASAAAAASFASALSKATKGIISGIGQLNVFHGVAKAIGPTLSRLGNMIKRTFIFNVVTAGLRELRSALSSYLGTNAEFVAALTAVKSNLATAFEPIYESVLPALTSLMEVMSRAIAVIAQFVAGLFGTTAKQAQKNAKALNEQAKATKDVKEEAEEAAKTVAAFDELNKLSADKKKSEESSLAKEADEPQGFDWEFEDTAFDSWGEAFSWFLDRVKDGIAQLKDAFERFADWLNDFSGKLYDMFKFPGVEEKVIALGVDLADAFNELVDKIDWEQLGRALGAGLNSAINFLNSFIGEFEWDNLGDSLAQFVNGLADEVDWCGFGELLWSGFEIALKTLAGFITGLNMPELAEAASDVVIGFFDSMSETLDTIPWEEIGLQIATFLTNLKWAEMFESVYNAVQSALEALRGLLDGFFSGFGEFGQPFIEMVDTIIGAIEQMMGMTKRWIGTLDFGPISKAFLNLSKSVSGLVAVISEGLLWAYENVLLPLAGWVIEEAAPVLINLLAAAIGLLSAALAKIQPVLAWVWENILQPIAEFAWGVISGGIEAITNTIQKLTDLLNGNTTFSEFIDSLAPGEAIILGLGIALGGIAAVFGVASAAIAAFNAVAAIAAGVIALLTSPIAAVVAVIAALVAGFVLLYQHTDWFRGFIDGIIDGAKELIPGIIDGISEAWNSFLDWMDGLWEDIVNGFKKFFGISSPSTVMAEQGGFLIDGLLRGISETWKSITNFFSEKVEGIKKTLSEAWNNIKETASEKWDSIKETVGEKWDAIKAGAETKFGEVKGKISDAWESAKEDASKKWDTVKGNLENTWETIKASAQGKFDEAKERISDAWKNTDSESYRNWLTIKSTLNTAWGNVKNDAQTKFSEIKGKVIDAWNRANTESSTVWGAIGRTLINAWNGVKKSANEKFTETRQKIIDVMSRLQDYSWTTIGKNIMTKIYNGLVSMWSTISTWASNVASSLMNLFQGAANSVKNAVSSAVSSASGARTVSAQSSSFPVAAAPESPLDLLRSASINATPVPAISAYSVPNIARGSVIPANSSFASAIGGGARSDNTLDAMVDAFKQAVSETGMGDGKIELVVNLDGEVLFKNTYSRLKSGLRMGTVSL